MEVIKTCKHCAYGGAYMKDESMFFCKCDQVERKTREDKDERFTKYLEKDIGETCKYFMSWVEVDKIDIETIVKYNIKVKCPYCGKEHFLQDVKEQDTTIVICNCGKKFEAFWEV